MTAKAIPDPELEDSVTTNDSTDEYTYRCPHCDASYADERLARVHITRADDPTHHHRNGLMPEEEIEVVDDNGQIVATRSKRPEDVDLSEVSMRDFPTDLTTKRKHALVVATRHPEIDNRRELTTMVHERLADNSWETSPPSHQTVRRALDEFYHPHEDETTAGLPERGLSVISKTVHQREWSQHRRPVRFGSRARQTRGFSGRPVDWDMRTHSQPDPPIGYLLHPEVPVCRSGSRVGSE